MQPSSLSSDFIIYLSTILAACYLSFLFIKTKYMKKLDKQQKDIHKQNQLLEQLGKELQETKINFEEKVQERTEALGKEQARLRASIDNLAVGFIMTDKENIPISMNKAALRILTVESIPSIQSIPHLTRKGSGFSLEPEVSRCLQEKTTINLPEVTTKDRSLHIFISPIIVTTVHNSHDCIGTVILIQDVTEEKMLERSKDEFLSIASHELRTPLTSILGYIAYIKSYHLGNIHDPELIEMLDRINESGKRLIRMVNDLLDTSRLEQKRMQFKIQPVDISSTVKDIIKEYQVLAKEKNTRIEFVETDENLPHVKADPDRLKQIIINLLGNSLKFTENGEIIIKAETTPGNMIKVSIADTGRGISDETKNLLFKKFQQAADSIYTRDTGGTGLGLYISKLLAEGMQGTIQLEGSSVDKGTTFSFSLPTTTEQIEKPA